MTRYCFSDNEELFLHSVEAETINDALAEAREVYPDGPVYIGYWMSAEPTTGVWVVEGVSKFTAE